MNIDNLSADLVFAQAKWFDFSDPTTWDVVYPSMETPEDVKALAEALEIELDPECTDDDLTEIVSDQVRERLEEDEHIYPLINYIYPIRANFPERTQFLLLTQPTNMILVTVDDDPYLALTGGGMDMTWYIVRAYVTLGFLPPLEYCNGPNIPGEAKKDLAAACVASLEGAQKRLEWKLDAARRTLEAG